MGEARDALGHAVATDYVKGASIRELAEKYNRSYGFIHRLVHENVENVRGRGGATRAKKAE